MLFRFTQFPSLAENSQTVIYYPIPPPKHSFWHTMFRKKRIAAMKTEAEVWDLSSYSRDGWSFFTGRAAASQSEWRSGACPLPGQIKCFWWGWLNCNFRLKFSGVIKINERLWRRWSGDAAPLSKQRLPVAQQRHPRFGHSVHYAYTKTWAQW